MCSLSMYKTDLTNKNIFNCSNRFLPKNLASYRNYESFNEYLRRDYLVAKGTVQEQIMFEIPALP